DYVPNIRLKPGVSYRKKEKGNRSATKFLSFMRLLKKRCRILPAGGLGAYGHHPANGSSSGLTG
ncbi:MAG: hypothetical protein GQ560_00720, partial [Dehalococcoidia bacterium]|nr:hypothetical protein [Dehalococcoidia bacterium]